MGLVSPFRGTSRFEVISKIGEGGTGLVYEALDRERGSRVALKTLRLVDAESLLLLKNEFRAIHDLDHPNLVVPKELFEEHGLWFFTMDFIHGMNFTRYVRPGAPASMLPPPAGATALREGHWGGDRSGVLDEGRLRAALSQLVKGLCALHADHKVHRDIKPSNVLVTPEGGVRILDFGIVSDLTRAARANDGAVVGTVLYLAPEQATGEVVTPAADWYAVGEMIYQALTGSLPFAGAMHDILAAKMMGEPARPETLAPRLPKDLCDLCVDLLRTDPALRPEGFEILGRLGIAADPESMRVATPAAFVGRRQELSELEQAFASVTEGRAVTLIVEGESGVGKSLLIGEFARRMALVSGALVFRGRCYERESVPYKAVDSLVDDLADFLSSLPRGEAAAILPAQAALLRQLFPVLDTVQAVREERITNMDVRNPQEVRARMFELLRELFAAIARQRPLILVIDDVQWADADSLALLSELLRPPGAPPLLLLASIRTGTESGGNAAMHERLARLPGVVRHVHLEALPPSDARALVGELLRGAGDRPMAPAEIDAIATDAKGHPLFIDELVRRRATQGVEGVVVRLDEALRERAARLPPTPRRLLELIAVAGVPLEQRVIAGAAALDLGQVFDAVGALRAAHLVRSSGVYRHDTVEAYHDRVREAVLAKIDAAVRKDWHGRLALALEQTEHPDAEMLAAHWEGAGNLVRAAEYAVRAADQAATALAFDQAAALYQRALILPHEGNAGVGLEGKLAEALTNAGRGAEAARVFLDLAGDGTSNEAIDLRRRAAEELLCSGHMDEGAKVLEAVLVATGIRPPRSPLAVLFRLVFYRIVLAVRGLKFVPRAEREIDPRALLRLDCLYSAGVGLGMADAARARQYQARGLIEALRLGEKSRIARLLGFYAAQYAGAGEPVYAKVMAMQRMLVAMADELQQPLVRALSSVASAYANNLTGRWGASRESFVQAEAIFRDQCVGVAYELATVRSLLCRTLQSMGELEELGRRAEATLREAEQKGDRYTVINLRSTATSFLALVRDDPDEAQRQVDLASAHLATTGFHVQHYFCLVAQALVCLYGGDAARTHAEIAARWPAVKRSMILTVQSVRLILSDVRARACIAMAAAGRTELLAEAERHVRAIEKENRPWASAQASLLRAGMCHLAGSRSEVLSHLAAAEAGFAATQMALSLAVVRRRRALVLEEGPEAAKLRADAEAWMRTQGIGSPARMTALFSPGFGAEAAAAGPGQGAKSAQGVA